MTPHLTDPFLPDETLAVAAWPDAVIDQMGHDPRSPYTERFWLPILGPTTTFLLRHLADRLDQCPDGFDLPLADTAHALGLGTKGGRNSPFLRAIARAVKFNAIQHSGGSSIAVRRRLAPLTRQQVSRLPAPLRAAHDEWNREAIRRPDPEQIRRRARRLALSLAELGEPDEAIERQLHRWKIHPAMAHDAVNWTRLRRRESSRHITPDSGQEPAAGATTVA